jgi:hypothetical protein
MTSQEGSDRTQELSQTHYDNAITRSRSARDLAGGEQDHNVPYPNDYESESSLQRDEMLDMPDAGADEDEEDTALETQKPGDPGYIDLLADWGEAGAHNDSEDEELQNALIKETEEDEQERPEGAEDHGQEQEASPTVHIDDFSQSPSQARLTQITESQRFAKTPYKTPTIGGRKRTYQQAYKDDSPELPRKPALGNGRRSAAVSMSQVFAATQANTSPFIGLPGQEPHSDLPSPGFGLQPFPENNDNDDEDSPLQPTSSERQPNLRSKSDPLDHYTPAKESQARREARRRAQQVVDESQASETQDSLGFGDDSINYHCRWQQRQQEIYRKNLSSSSPRLSVPEVASKSSPIRPSSSTRGDQPPPATRVKIMMASSPRDMPFVAPENESELETEPEDDSGRGHASSSQSTQPDGENKENMAEQALRVPETLYQPTRSFEGAPPAIQESPLIKQGQKGNNKSLLPVMSSSQAFAVADSQADRVPSQLRPGNVAGSPALEGGLDYIPQSPDEAPEEPTRASHSLQAILERGKQPSTRRQTSTESEMAVLATTNQSRLSPASKIPETSSNEVLGQSSSGLGSKRPAADSDERAVFRTAQSHIQPSNIDSVEAPMATMSSQPVATTPPGRRRKRLGLADIAAESSPQKSQSDSFNASQALGLDKEYMSPGARRLGALGATLAELSEESEGVEVGAAMPDDPKCDAEQRDPHSGPSNSMKQPLSPTPSMRPRREPKLTAKAKSALKSRPQAKGTRNRVPKWDVEDVSPQKMVPTSTAPIQTTNQVSKKRKSTAADAPAATEPPTTTTKRTKLSNTKAVPATASTSRADAEANVVPLDQLVGDAPSSDMMAVNEAPLVPQMAGEDDDRTASAVINDQITAPNMVFAFFNGKSRGYYPALCQGRSTTDSSRYTVQWRGYAEGEIDEHGVRSLDLRVGDLVKVELDGFPKVSHVIKGFEDLVDVNSLPPSSQPWLTDIRGYKSVIVAPKQRKSLPADVSVDAVKKVPVSALYLDSNMWGQMKNRTYTYQARIQLTVMNGVSTPAAPPSIPSTPSSRHRRRNATSLPPSSSAASIDLTRSLFSNMLFALSYKDEGRKRDLVKMIHDNGGTVLKDSFPDMFENGSVKMKGKYAEFSFAALLTDGHSRKAKYLHALALGLPCLSGRWIDACVNADKLADWETYLLPAGECAELEGAVKSRTLSLGQDITTTKIADIIDARDVTFKGIRALFIAPKLKGKAKEAQDGILELLNLLAPAQLDLEQSMDAAKSLIESAATTKEPVEYVFVGEQEVETASEALLSSEQGASRSKRGRKGAKEGKVDEDVDMKDGTLGGADPALKIMSNEDIIQSLILGRLWTASQ